MMKRLATITLLGLALAAADLAREGDDRLGKPAPPLNLPHWLNSPPLETKSLQGKVVLIRWWTDGCSFCSASAPALRVFDQEYGPRGLQVIGIFHPKPAGDGNLQRVREGARRLGFTFPIALDTDWSALRRWWFDSGTRDWTSVSFLVDKRGMIRYIHPGGTIEEQDFREIEQMIQRLLAQ